MRQEPLATRWEGAQLQVLRHGQVIDAIPADDIQRVILVCSGGGDTPSNLDFALIDTGAEHVLLPVDSGIAACVYFERQSWWTGRACIHWVTAPHGALPRHLCQGVWLLRSHRPAFLRLPAAQLQALIGQWPQEGPQTWEQRKWAHIGARRHLAALTKQPVPRA